MDDMTNTDLAAKSSLRQRTRKLLLGKCDAFLSHSWHDALEPKWAAIDQWAIDFEGTHGGQPPMLWLDKVRAALARTRCT